MKRNIAKMMADFSPEKYADERRERIMTLLEKKAKTKALVEAPEVEEEEGGKGPADLVAALQASMRQVKKNR